MSINIVQRLASGAGLGSFLCLVINCVPAIAQTVATCEVIDDYIPVGVEYPIREPDPAHISGTEPHSRVNVRSGPGPEFTAIGYGLVGDYVEVTAQAFSSECDTWMKVYFPMSGTRGWIRADYIELTYARGWWD